MQAAFGAMLTFMVFDKIFSVQYTLWVVPFFAFLRLPIGKFAALIVGDTVVYIAIFTMFLHFDDGRFDEFHR